MRSREALLGRDEDGRAPHPHAWALDGFAEVVRHDAGVTDVLTEVGVLLAFAALLLGVGSWRLRRVITR